LFRTARPPVRKFERRSGLGGDQAVLEGERREGGGIVEVQLGFALLPWSRNKTSILFLWFNVQKIGVFRTYFLFFGPKNSVTERRSLPEPIPFTAYYDFSPWPDPFNPAKNPW
jgi:hypothetical protein